MLIGNLFADTVLLTIKIGSWVWAVTESQIIYLIIAAIVGLVAEFIVGWRLPFGFVGAILAAILGIWLLTHVILISIPGDPVIYGVPLFKALLGAIILVALWHMITYRSWGHRRRYYRRA
ncbi:MAG TPA: hypothetical protein VFN23_19440 [Ktedonobacteraceae bacterium]|nr:hypothetical protein [Ktedonobacteraceae bacterium]